MAHLHCCASSSRLLARPQGSGARAMEFTNLNARNGTLAWPLGWAGPDLLAVATAQPTISLQLLTAERPRLHFVAFVLAMTPHPASADTIAQAINRPMREVLASLGLSGLRGVRRVLG